MTFIEYNYFSRPGQEIIVDLLIRSGANVNAANVKLETPLHFAAHLGYEKIIEQLVENGAEVEFRNEQHKTPLFFAVLSGIPTNKKALIDECITITFQFFKGELNAVYMLIKHGADLNTADRESNTVLHVAAKFGNIGFYSIVL